MYASIVVPLDGSEFGNRALPVALMLASRSDAAVHLVHVQEPVVVPEGAPMYDTRLYHDLQQETRSDLIAIAARFTREASLRVDAEFLEGRVVPTLQQYLEDRRHDLVVMMTHGRGGLSRAWLGSVADGLVRHAPVPLLLMREETEWLRDPVEPLFRRILIPLDGSAMAEEVLDHVVSLGTPDETVYALLTVVGQQTPLEYPHADSGTVTGRSHVEQQRDAALGYLNGVAEELRKSGALVEAQVEVHHQPAQGVLDVANERHIDLIALSTHGRGAMSRLFLGSLADKVVRGTTKPILVYRPAGGGAASVERDGESVTPRAAA